MTVTDERLAEIEARAAAATPGPWDYESDSADLIPSDPTTYRVFAPADGKVLFDTLNSQAGEIVTEYDEEGFAHAWDALGLANMKFAAHARTDVPDLVAALRAERARADAAESEIAATRIVLAGTDISSLPCDKTLTSIAQVRMADRAFAWGRVERGDARCATFEEDLAAFRARAEAAEADNKALTEEHDFLTRMAFYEVPGHPSHRLPWKDRADAAEARLREAEDAAYRRALEDALSACTWATGVPAVAVAIRALAEEGMPREEAPNEKLRALYARGKELRSSSGEHAKPDEQEHG